MPARLLITAGPLEGSELWIEYDVVRLGSDADCELQVVDAGLEPHVFTLRYSDGKFTLYNRTSQPLRLDSKLVESNGSNVWRSGKTLELSGGTTLKLETSGDGAPAPQAVETARPTLVTSADAFDLGPAVPVGGVAAETAPKKKTGQAIAVALLFAAALGVLLMEEPTAAPAGSQVKSFGELSAALRDEKSLSPDLWIRFSEAYAAAYRGRTEEADAAYRRLRDRLDWEKSLLSQAGRSAPPILNDADAYVKQRLAGQ